MDFMQLDANLILCDHASMAGNGKLTMVGAGWQQAKGPVIPLIGIGIMIRLPFGDNGQLHEWELSFLDQDGQLVQDKEGKTVRIDGSFQRHPDSENPKPGQEEAVNFPLNVGPFYLDPGTYEWRLTIDGEHNPRWRHVFRVV